VTVTALLARPNAAPEWLPDTWRSHAAAQQPEWPDPAALRAASAALALSPGLVAADEVYALRRELVRAAHAGAFVVQAGDCAETFDGPHPGHVLGQLGLLRSLSEALHLPVVPIGRIAGQFAKPRSAPTELVDGRNLPSFRGHLVNDPAPLPEARIPDAGRLLRGYEHPSATMDLLRAAARGGQALPRHWAHTAPAVWTSHEALLLDFEEPLVRRDQGAGSWVLTSTHLPWIGERTRQIGGAHLAFAAGLANPIGCKVGPGTEPLELQRTCAALDPRREPGRLVLIVRMSAALVESRLPPLVEAVERAGHCVVWLCDPMHGNTVRAAGGYKTRHVEAITAELTAFFAAVRGAGGWPGGVHLEATHEEVTECLGGESGLAERDLSTAYTTACDPRLNARQAEEVARHVARLTRTGRTPRS
jgi:3-deoxy-7-phosphoheptulonate synthase